MNFVEERLIRVPVAGPVLMKGATGVVPPVPVVPAKVLAPRVASFYSS